MSSDLEALRELYAEWARGDFSRNDLFDPDVITRTHGYPEAVDARGLEELRAALAGWLEPWQRGYVVEAEDFIVDGSRIAVMIRWRGSGRESGTPMESEGAHLWTFRDGRAVGYEVYRSREEALTALRSG